MTRDEAFEILKENICGMCAYTSKSMESCDICSCDNRDAIKTLENQEYKTNQLINKLSKMPLMVIETAYLYATKYTLYGVDVTEKWETATQNASALEKAYNKGYYDALKRENKLADKYRQIEDIYYHQRGEALENSLRTIIEDGK